MIASWGAMGEHIFKLLMLDTAFWRFINRFCIPRQDRESIGKTIFLLFWIVLLRLPPWDSCEVRASCSWGIRKPATSDNYVRHSIQLCKLDLLVKEPFFSNLDFAASSMQENDTRVQVHECVFSSHHLRTGWMREAGLPFPKPIEGGCPGLTNTGLGCGTAGGGSSLILGCAAIHCDGLACPGPVMQ